MVDQDFVLRIPDGVALDVAAPLLCAGITLYSPLKHWGAGPGKKVAIVGMGGLGHMGVKIAHALGAEVTVLSQTLRKQDDGQALRRGPLLRDQRRPDLHRVGRQFRPDHQHRLGDAADGQVPLPAAPERHLVNVGAPAEPLSVPAFSLLGMRRSWAGSSIGGIRETQEMLDFCAEHGLGAEIEVISGEQIDEAWDRVVDGDVRYRFVIDTSTFD